MEDEREDEKTSRNGDRAEDDRAECNRPQACASRGRCESGHGARSSTSAKRAIVCFRPAHLRSGDATHSKCRRSSACNASESANARSPHVAIGASIAISLSRNLRLATHVKRASPLPPPPPRSPLRNLAAQSVNTSAPTLTTPKTTTTMRARAHARASYKRRVE